MKKYFDIYCENNFVARVNKLSPFIWALVRQYEYLRKATFSVIETDIESFCKVSHEIYNTAGKDPNTVLFILR